MQERVGWPTPGQKLEVRLLHPRRCSLISEDSHQLLELIKHNQISYGLYRTLTRRQIGSLKLKPSGQWKEMRTGILQVQSQFSTDLQNIAQACQMMSWLDARRQRKDGSIGLRRDQVRLLTDPRSRSRPTHICYYFKTSLDTAFDI